MNPNQIAQTLRAARKGKELSQAKLGFKAEVSRETISIAERTGHCTARTAERLAAVLEIPVESLRGEG
jgi:DNA-binding XRE family transcriptional regulator